MKTLIAILCLFSSLSAQAAKPMNFVVILIDDTPPEYFGAYGGKKYPTPNIDQLARDGERFNNAFSVSPMCTPARFALQTGRYPGRCIEAKFKETQGDGSQPCMIEWNTSIWPDEPTLAKQLAAKGYNTGLAGKWHLMAGHNHPELPDLGNGSLDNPDTLKAMQQRQRIIQESICASAGFTHARSLYLENCEEEPLVPYHNIPYITRGAIELLREFAKDKKPFLLFANPTGIHGPWHADVLERDLRYTPGGYVEEVYDYAPDYAALKKTVMDFTSGEKHKYVGLADIDHQVGVIRTELEKLGLAENTAIVFTADHGIEPGKASVYDRGLRVPLIAYWPGLTEPGSTSDALVQHVDLTAAIAATAGVPNLGKTMDGVDLRPVLREPGNKVRDIAYFECGYSRAVTDGRYKLISIRLPEAVIADAEAGKFKWMTVGMGSGHGKHAAFSQLAYPDYYEPDQLYDLKSDPFEQVSLWNHPEREKVKQRMRAALSGITSTMPYAFPEDEQPFFSTESYRKLAETTRRENNPYSKPWVKRDHDEIIWPPKEKQ